jgi:hypothetical protein
MPVDEGVDPLPLLLGHGAHGGRRHTSRPAEYLARWAETMWTSWCEFITASGVDRAKHLAIVRALQKREPQGFTAR